MKNLTEMHCVSVDAKTPLATEPEIAEMSPQIHGWQIVTQKSIRRLEHVFKFPDFAEGLAFTQKIGELAESENHHPALLTEWGRVTVTWSTDKIKGLHRNDFIMAAKTETIYGSHAKA